MGLFLYGVGVISCLFILVSMGQLIIQHWQDGGDLWHDAYLWLSMCVFLFAAGVGEWGVMRVIQTFQGSVIYAQPPSTAWIVAVTLVLGANAGMRAVAIQHPVRGNWYVWGCLMWGLFTVFWLQP